MKLSEIIIGLLLFSAMITGSVYWVEGMSTAYNVTTDTSFASTYDKTNELSSLGGEIYNKTQAGQLNVIDFTVVPIIGALKLIGNSITTVTDLVVAFTTKLGMPSWIPTTILAIFTTMVAFLIIGSILKRDI